MLATKPKKEVISSYLDSMISDYLPDPLSQLPSFSPVSFPEDKDHFKPRYMSGIHDILGAHFFKCPSAPQKQVIVLTSHHTAIKHMLKMGKKKGGSGKNVKVHGEAGYCTTLEYLMETCESEEVELGYRVKAYEVIS